MDGQWTMGVQVPAKSFFIAGETGAYLIGDYTIQHYTIIILSLGNL